MAYADIGSSACNGPTPFVASKTRTYVLGAGRKGVVHSRTEEPRRAGQKAEKHSAQETSILCRSKASKSKLLNNSPEAQKMNLSSQPNRRTKKHSNLVDNRCNRWTRNVLCSLLLTSGPTLCCFLKYFLCMACPEQNMIPYSLMCSVSCIFSTCEYRLQFV